VATEAAWLNGKKWKKSRKEQKKLLTGIGLLMEGTSVYFVAKSLRFVTDIR